MGAFQRLQQDVNGYVAEAMDGFSCEQFHGPKVMRDGMLGFGRFRAYECNLIDSPLMQRLRRIHQTALAYLTYPSAQHTRFEHSLGCVMLVDRMVRAMRERGMEGLRDRTVAELRLAALLHDCGHVAFSHASEPLVEATHLYQEAHAEQPERFEPGVKPHEMLSHLIVSSPAFHAVWQDIVDLYGDDRDTGLSLEEIQIENVANLILGRPPAPQLAFVAQLINGPMDADKLDYMGRDALFTGLKMQVDIDRLLYTFRRVPLHGKREKVLAIDLQGAINVEQLVFNKMLLYSSVYHHHKVRTGLCLIPALGRAMQQAAPDLADHISDPDYVYMPYQRPSDFLRADDIALLALHTFSADRVRELAQRIRDRKIPKRAVVLTEGTMEFDTGAETKYEYVEFIEGHDPAQEPQAQKIAAFEQELATASGVEPDLVFLDVPGIPTLEEAEEVIVMRGHKPCGRPQLVTLSQVYPMSKCAEAYGTFKHRSYVFAPQEKRREVARAAVPLLRKRFGIKVAQGALDAAKHKPPLALKDCD